MQQNKEAPSDIEEKVIRVEQIRIAYQTLSKESVSGKE